MGRIITHTTPADGSLATLPGRAGFIGVGTRSLHGTILAAAVSSLLLIFTACETGDASSGEDPDIPPSSSTQGGLTRVTITGFDGDGIGDSGHALTNGPTVEFEWEHEFGPDDSPGFDIGWEIGGSEDFYRVRSSAGYSWEGMEGMFLLVTVQGFTGPGTYSTATHPDTTVHFDWAGDEDPDSGEQPTFELDTTSEDDCTVVIGDDPLTGSLLCTDLVPVVDGQVADGSSFALEATWSGLTTPY